MPNREKAHASGYVVKLQKKTIFLIEAYEYKTNNSVEALKN